MLAQFEDQLVVILLGSAVVSFVLALFEGGNDWTAFVDPLVVCFAFSPLPFYSDLYLCMFLLFARLRLFLLCFACVGCIQWLTLESKLLVKNLLL